MLDEAPSLTAAVQAKLLTAIEDGKIRRVGGNDDLAVDVRVVATANTDLRELVARGEFREDLYHRLNLLTLNLPPLRERGLDILALANHLLRRLAQRYQSSVSAISADQESFLREYSWPGNVRELMHELERQLVWNGGEQLDFSHLSLEKSQAAQQPSCPPTPSLSPPADWLARGWRFPQGGFSLQEANDRLIRLALAQTDGNVSAAARLLGVKRDYLRYRLK